MLGGNRRDENVRLKTSVKIWSSPPIPIVSKDAWPCMMFFNFFSCSKEEKSKSVVVVDNVLARDSLAKQ